MLEGEFFWVLKIVALMLLLVCVNFLVPKLMDSDNTKAKFGTGVVLLVIYTLVGVLLLHSFATDASSVEDCVTRMVFAFVFLNLIVLLTAGLYFISRDKRKMSEMEKLKLKDL